MPLNNDPGETQSDASDLRGIAGRAYLFAYPLVLIEATRAGQPTNVFTHVPQFPRPDTRKVIRPNADTLYTMAWIDLAALATVCDVVPLKGLNRAFVVRGLEVMRQGKNPGIAALALNLLLMARREPLRLNPQHWRSFLMLGLVNNVRLRRFVN